MPASSSEPRNPNARHEAHLSKHRPIRNASAHQGVEGHVAAEPVFESPLQPAVGAASGSIAQRLLAARNKAVRRCAEPAALLPFPALDPSGAEDSQGRAVPDSPTLPQPADRPARVARAASKPRNQEEPRDPVILRSDHAILSGAEPRSQFAVGRERAEIQRAVIQDRRSAYRATLTHRISVDKAEAGVRPHPL